MCLCSCWTCTGQSGRTVPGVGSAYGEDRPCVQCWVTEADPVCPQEPVCSAAPAPVGLPGCLPAGRRPPAPVLTSSTPGPASSRGPCSSRSAAAAAGSYARSLTTVRRGRPLYKCPAFPRPVSAAGLLLVLMHLSVLREQNSGPFHFASPWLRQSCGCAAGPSSARGAGSVT